MKATALLRDFGQSLWLDNITRDLLNNGTLEHYINDLSITGLTSNPTIFDHAVKNSAAYDSAILDGSRRGKGGETVFFDLALKDITRAADLFSTRLRSHKRSRWLGVPGGSTFFGSRHDKDSCRGEGSLRPRSTTERLHQNSRHRRRHSGYRRGDLRGRAHQCNPTLLVRPICCCGRSIPPRN